MVQQVLDGKVRTVGEEAVGTGGLLLHLRHGIKGIGMVEHAGFPHQGGLPGIVEFRVIVGFAGNGRSADGGAVGLGPVQDDLEAFRRIQVPAGNLLRTRRPQQETQPSPSQEEPWTTMDPDLKLLASRTVRDKCLLFKPPSL